MDQRAEIIHQILPKIALCIEYVLHLAKNMVNGGKHFIHGAFGFYRNMYNFLEVKDY